MELYQAAQESNELKQRWFVNDLTKQSRLESGEKMYIIERDFSIDLLGEGECSVSDLVYITKQRGGIRQFKSLDAVYRALSQIGVSKFEIRSSYSQGE